MTMTDVKGLTLEELEAFAAAQGEEKYRGKQLFDWLYAKEAASFHEMTSLPARLREKLSAAARIGSIRLAARRTSEVDGTSKFLFELADGKSIESVLIPPQTAFADGEARAEEEQRRLTLCVSTQVGCPLDCAFCATGTMGFHRDLTPGEIIDQLIQARTAASRRITNLVYMGMGEPLLNYENVMKSVDIVTTGMGIAARRVTISTAGIVPGIRRMAAERRKVKLAISLHSLDDRTRSDLMPINRKYGIAEIADAAAAYTRALRKRVTFEYILFQGLNDSDEDIGRLVRLARSVPSKINIIPFHSIGPAAGGGRTAAGLRAAPAAHAEDFARRLREAHLTVFVRSSAGEDIDGACGQLAVRTGRSRPRRLGAGNMSAASA